MFYNIIKIRTFEINGKDRIKKMVKEEMNRKRLQGKELIIIKNLYFVRIH